MMQLLGIIIPAFRHEHLVKGDSQHGWSEITSLSKYLGATCRSIKLHKDPFHRLAKLHLKLLFTFTASYTSKLAIPT